MGNYGMGFEEVYSSNDRFDALARLKEYRENEPEYTFKLVVALVKA